MGFCIGIVWRSNSRQLLMIKLSDDDPVEEQVKARTYTLNNAAQILGIKTQTLRYASQELALDSFLDPDGTIRFPVYTFEPTADDPDMREMIAGYERLKSRDLRDVLRH